MQPALAFVSSFAGLRSRQQLGLLTSRSAGLRLLATGPSKPRKPVKAASASYDEEDDSYNAGGFYEDDDRPAREGARYPSRGERGERFEREERSFGGRERGPSRRWDGGSGRERGAGGRFDGGGGGRWGGRGDREARPWAREDKEKAPTIKDEQKGTDFLYGVGPVLAALTHKRRALHKLYVKKPSEDAPGGQKKKDKSELFQIEELAKAQGIPIEFVDKGVLNVLSENRPHQGLVMDVGPLSFKFIKSLEPAAPPAPDDSGRTRWPLWLALDQVWDPQNFGAILRTAFFLGADGVVVCSKNSAPLSPAVSKASSGAMESVVCHSANNMMKFLEDSRANGWEVLGTGLGKDAVPCTEVTVERPTVVVLGNEAYGLRTNVLNACDRLLYIGGRDRREPEPGDVDSLNVSVAAGILLHHLLHS
eukprot:tig00020556_g10998.t1